MIFRKSTNKAEELSEFFRTSSGDFVARRRRIIALYLGGIASLGVVALYQVGLIKRVPEPPLPFLDAETVDASGEAYASLSMPDAVLGIGGYALTMALAAAGGEDRTTERPWLPIAMAAKVVVDAVSGLVLTAEQAAKHRAFCSWCLAAAAVSIVAVPQALPEAAAALRRGRRAVTQVRIS